MQIIYVLPFTLVSFVLGTGCFWVPRWCRYALAALVGPVAFARCAIVGMVAILLSADSLGFSFDEGVAPMSRHGALLLALIYLLPGSMGAALAVLVANRIQP